MCSNKDLSNIRLVNAVVHSFIYLRSVNPYKVN